MSNSFDFEQFKANAIEQLKAGVPLSGKDGVLVPLLENLLNSALEGEMDSHLEGGECELSNRRHGHMSKHVQTSMGEVTINTPRDRDGTFNPQVVRKREKILADSLADRIMTLSKILCKWKQDSAVSLFLYLDSVFKNKHKLIHNQAPVMNRLCPFLLNLHK